MADAYKLEWNYLNELPGEPGAPISYDEAHCEFLIRFMEPPSGKGHCAFLSVNVITSVIAAQLGIGPNGRRAYLVADSMTQADFRQRVAEAVKHAFAHLPRPEALAQLDQTYVWQNQDFREEFRCDALSVRDLRALVEKAFAGVRRGEGSEAFITRHAFTDLQVQAIYRFICFMATDGDEGVDEEQLPAVRKWRDCARREQ